LRAQLYADKAIQTESIGEKGEYYWDLVMTQRKLQSYLNEAGLVLEAVAV